MYYEINHRIILYRLQHNGVMMHYNVNYVPQYTVQRSLWNFQCFLMINIWPSLMASGPAYKADLFSGPYKLKYIGTYLSPLSMYSSYPVKQEL